MAAALDAIRNEEWIAVTGWTHTDVARWDLKYLEDPEGVLVKQKKFTLQLGRIKEDMPEVYAFLDNLRPLEKCKRLWFEL